MPTLTAVVLGDPWWTAFFAVVVLIGARELNALFCAAGHQSSVRVTALTTLAVFAGVRFPELPLLLPALSLVMMGAGTLGVSRRHWDMAFSGAPFQYEWPGAAYLMMGMTGIFGVIVLFREMRRK